MEEKHPKPCNIFSLWSIFFAYHFMLSFTFITFLQNMTTLHSIFEFHWVSSHLHHMNRVLIPPSESFWVSQSLQAIFSVDFQWLHVSRGIASVSCPRSRPAKCTAAWQQRPLLQCNSRPSLFHTYPSHIGQKCSHKSAELLHCPSPMDRGHSQHQPTIPQQTEFLQPLFPQSWR